jgi:EmrB/QacA subfamily drug resistance transporter
MTTMITRPATGQAAAAGGASPATVVLASLAFLMVTLDALVVVTALPSIHASLGGGTGGLQWIVNAYNLTFAAGIVTGAALGDRFGRRRLFMIGLASFTLASAACAVAPTLGWLIAFRAFQGLGGAILTPVGLALITEAFPPSRRGAAIGLWGGIAGLGVAAGPLVGGAVTQGLDWHWIFWVNVPVGLIAVAGCAATLRESRGGRRPLDLPGMALVALALAALADAVVEAPDRGWVAPRTLALLTVGAVALAGFVVWERYAPAPMIPLRLLRIRAFAAANVANMFSSASTFSAAYVMSQYFQFGRGDSPLGTGLRFLPWTAMPLVFAPLAGAWSDRVGARRLAVPGLVMQAAGFAVIVALAGTAQPWAAYAGPFVVAGIGVSLALPTLPTAALSVVAPTEIGVAAGVVNTVQRLGPVVGVAVVSAVFAAHGSLASASEVTSGFRWALGASAVFSLIGAGVASIIGRRRTAAEG